MKTVFYPAYDNNYTALQKVGFVVLVPDNYDAGKANPWMFFLHGMGNLGDGRQESLENLILGYKYTPDAARVNAPVPKDFISAVDLYGIVAVVPNYSSFFQPESWNYVYDLVKTKYNLTGKFLGTGFSWGAGSLMKYVRSAFSNASRVALACPVAPTNESGGDWNNVKNGRTIYWDFVNKGDDNGPTNLSVSQTMINSFNATTPIIKGLLTAKDINGHGGVEWALALAPPKTPGGVGFTDASENIYQLYIDILKAEPRLPKSGTLQPPASSPVAAFNLVDQQIVTTSVFDLDASASIGVKTGWDAFKWDIKPINAPWMTLQDGAYGGPKKRISNLGNGSYSIALTVKDPVGNTAQKAVTITVKLDGTTTKQPLSFEWGTQTLTFNDGSKEKSGAKFITASGTIYEI